MAGLKRFPAYLQDMQGEIEGHARDLGLDFFPIDRVLFASDAPFDPEKGPMYIRETIKIIDGLDIPEANRHAIYHGNAERLMRLH